MIPFNKFIVLFILTLFHYSLQATTYYSTSDGNWNSPIWSTIGHSSTSNLTSLPCSFSGNDVVQVSHGISSNCSMRISGSSTIVLNAGSSFVLNDELTLNGTSNIIIAPTASMTINGNLIMVGTSAVSVEGDFWVYGNVSMTGNSQVCGTGLAYYSGQLSTVGNANWCNTLPVEIVSFKGEVSNYNIALQWTTSSETNNDYYLVERSYDGVEFYSLGEIDGAGNSVDLITYNYLDVNVLEGINTYIYYRLKQVDFDGTFSYSPIIVVENSVKKDTNELFELYPNPAHEGFYIHLKNSTQDIVWTLYNANGQVVQQEILTPTTNQHYISTANYPSGIYLVNVNDGGNSITKKIVLQ